MVFFLSLFLGLWGGSMAFLYLFQDLSFSSEISGQFPTEPYVFTVSDLERRITGVVENSSKSVVSISVYKKVPVYETVYINPFRDLGSPFEILIPELKKKGTRREKVASGTGFFVRGDGVVVTNKHVIAQGEEFEITLNSGKTLPATLWAKDPLFDIAFLKVKEENNFPALPLGDSETLKIGQFVIAVGNVLGEFQNSVSFGVVSGLGRRVIASGGAETEVLEGVIQTDAAINRGNSGGPLLNLRGEVVGMNTAVAIGAENVGFAIPINRIKVDLAKLDKYGKIVYPFLGVYYESTREGALVKRVIENTPAQQAGLKEQDLIIEIQGQRLDRLHPLSSEIVKYNPGDKITLKVKRGEKVLIFDVVLEEFKEQDK